MSDQINPIYWIGAMTEQTIPNNIVPIDDITELPNLLCGVICLNAQNDQQLESWLRAFYSLPHRWSWYTCVIGETDYSQCVTDGLYDQDMLQQAIPSMQKRLEILEQIDRIDPLSGWLGLHRYRRINAYKNILSPTIYSFPIIDLLVPELYSSYRYALTEEKKGVLEADQLIDRIRICPQCNSGHLNYVDVCSNCYSIDIQSQSSLHCFTCGYIGDQQSFQRRGRLECPKCFTQLRHIGVDYDRPLENHICNSCSTMFVEAATMSHCLHCKSANKIDALVIRRIYQYRLGEHGEYCFLHGNSPQAPELSIKGKVDVSYFQNLLAWLNKIALRHETNHLVVALHLSSFNDYERQFGEVKLFSLIDQLSQQMSTILRDTDICCQIKQDLLLVLMPNTQSSSLSTLQDKLSKLSTLVEDNEFELDVYAWSLPDVVMGDEVALWLESNIGDIYAAR